MQLLHIIGTKAEGQALEILVLEPDSPPGDYVSLRDTMDEYQYIDIEFDNWPYCPTGSCFERAY